MMSKYSALIGVGAVICVSLAVAYAIYYSTDLYGTEEYIYILWSGYTQEDFDEEKVGNSTIIVLDWSGNYIDSYIVPHSLFVAASFFANRCQGDCCCQRPGSWR